MSTSGSPGAARWFVRGDLDGFFGLALDNLIQLLLIVGLCGFVLGFPPDLLYGQVLPASAISLLAGNLYYSWQAMQLARREGRDDVCAIPYGINTVSLFAYVFLVMLPVKIATGDPHKAWQAGVVACFGSGLIEVFGAFGLDWLRRNVPRAALLSTLAGIAVGFISLDFLFKTYAAPIVGLSTLAVVFLVYFGGLRFKGGVPGGLVAVALGTLLCWITGLAPTGEWAQATTGLGLQLPMPVVGDLFAGVEHIAPYLTVILPMGLFNLLGSLQNLDSAEAAGDRFETRPSLIANGAGTIVAALFGSCFPTTIYIGHPGWKSLGARIGYSWLNGAFMTLICFSGAFGIIAWLVPVEAGMAIVLWIAIVITAQAFDATPRAHAPAVVVGLMPGIAAWGALMLRHGVSAAGGTWNSALGVELDKVMKHSGLFAVESGFIFTAMILAACVVAVIERRFRVAAAWCGVAAAISVTGVMHSWAWSGAGPVMDLDVVATARAFGPNVQAAAGYAVAALVFLAAPLVAERPPEANDAADVADSATETDVAH